MKEELRGLLAGLETAKLMAEIHDKWQQKAAEFIVNNERYKDVDLVTQALAIAQEAAQAELQAYTDYCEKMTALVELKERQKIAENAGKAVN